MIYLWYYKILKQHILELKMSRKKLITKKKEWNVCADIILYLICFLFCDTNLLLEYFKPTHTHTHTHRNTYIYMYMCVHMCVYIYRAFLVAQTVNNLPAIQETWVQTLGWEDSVEKGMTTQCSILAWKMPWTEEPDGLLSMGLQRVRHNWATNAHTTAILVPFKAKILNNFLILE